MTVQTSSSTRFDPASLEILWGRLVGITEEMWNTILRTSYSTIIGAALDYGVALLDARGGQLAHASGSMPLFNNALPTITRDLLRRFEGRIYPGDVFGGNDPWLCCGHIPDLAIMTPVFKGDRLVAFATSVAHHADFGGSHGSKRVREVYEEGIFLPVMKFYERGKRVDPVYEILEANIRIPDMVIGDIEAQVNAGEVGVRSILRLMDENGLTDLAELVDELQSRSEQAMRDVISGLPNGTYRASGWADLEPEPVRLEVAVTIDGDEIIVDFDGTGPQQEVGGVNVTYNFTQADTHYAIKCVLAPHLPHNEGSTKPIKVLAPEGSIVNCTFPASINMRTRTSFHANPLVVEALAPLVPHLAPAGPGIMQSIRVVGTYPDGKGFNAPMFGGGGRGGSEDEDGIGGYIYPSSASGVSIEVFELSSPAMIAKKEYLTDSMGAGKFRGGPATHIIIKRLPGYTRPVRLRYNNYRNTIPASGLFGGKPGNLCDATWNGQPLLQGTELGSDGWTSFRTDDDVFSYNIPSGGGYGDPRERDPRLIEADIRSGLLTPEAAERDYGYRPGRSQSTLE